MIALAAPQRPDDRDLVLEELRSRPHTSTLDLSHLCGLSFHATCQALFALHQAGDVRFVSGKGNLKGGMLWSSTD